MVIGNTKVSTNEDVTKNLTSQDQQNLEDINNQSSTLDGSTMDNGERATF